MKIKWFALAVTATFLSGGTSAAVQDSPYGICAHVSYTHVDFPFAQQEFALLNEIGVNWVRTDYEWKKIETRQGTWNYSLLDQLLVLAKQDNINLYPILAYDVPWAAPAWKNLDQWGEYVRRTVSRYAGDIKYWEIWNEQNADGFWKDTANGRNYACLLRRSCEEIRKVSRDLKVVYGGTAGVPLQFIEDSLQAGAGNWFDVMNIHPYQWHGIPEDMIPQLKELRALMAKYGVGHKPIWITEVGWSTAPQPKLYNKALAAALKKIGLTGTTVAVIDEQKRSYVNSKKYDISKDFPILQNIVEIKLSQLSKLDIKEFPALLILGEVFPADYVSDVIDYVRWGGTLLCTDGLPLYFLQKMDEHGKQVTLQVNDRYSKQLHIGWETWWTNKKVPRDGTGVIPSNEFRNDFEPDSQLLVSRFLNESNLMAGDEFIPVAQTENSNYRGVVVAIYKLNSDLKGNVIVCTPSTKNEAISEALQAELLPRTYLVALSHGVERVFWYCLRSPEWAKYERESHFGITSKELARKPALTALATLIRQRPAGSRDLGIQQQNDIYFANWVRPDGTPTAAVWTVTPAVRTAVLSLDGTLKSASDWLGNPVILQPQQEKLSMTVGTGIIYLEGVKINEAYR